MNIVVRDIGVDAGLIMICDEKYYEEKNSEYDPELSKVIKLDPGKYYVKWKINNTWNGNVNGFGTLNAPSGNIIISDPCYCIKNESWEEWLDETNYGMDVPDGCLILDKMGGDGSYDVRLELNKIQE